jgi:hypothetical protein
MTKKCLTESTGRVAPNTLPLVAALADMERPLVRGWRQSEEELGEAGEGRSLRRRVTLIYAGCSAGAE